MITNVLVLLMVSFVPFLFYCMCSIKIALLNFMVTPCINNIQHFNYQLTYTTLKNVELLKHSKISKTAPTCFGLQGNHLQGATVSS